jgi:hypothetical protein
MKKTIKIRKEQAQGTQTISSGLLALLMLGMFFIPQMAVTAHAIDPSHHAGWHNGIAYLAEQEIRTKQQKAAARNEHYKTDTANNNIVEDKINEEEHSNECSAEMQREAVDC